MNKELREFINKLVEPMQKLSDAYESGKLEKEINQKISQKAKKDLDKIFNTCVEEYYNSYDPEFYKDRKGSLYDMYDVVSGEEDIEWETGPFSDKTHRVGNQYIFDKMWMEGWHGGATYSEKLDYFRRPYPDGYEMAYRKPVGEIKRKKKNGEFGKSIKPYSLWSYREVEKSRPIQEMADEQLDNYENGKDNYSNNTLSKTIQECIDSVLIDYGLNIN